MNARTEITTNTELFTIVFCIVSVINVGLHEFRLLE